MRLIMQASVAAVLAATLTHPARADAVTDWNVTAGNLIAEAKMGTPPANRIMAVTQTAVFEAVNAITHRYPGSTGALQAPPHASIDAAVAAANRATLAKLMPNQQAAITTAYERALSSISDGPGKTAGVELGEKAAAAVLAARADDGAAAPESYRPGTTAGTYVPTAGVAAPQWPQRKPWLMKSADQFRAPAPPALTSKTWARDLNEVKAIGSRNSTVRTPEQTEIARFWEYSLPSIYYGVVRSVAAVPGRDVTRNARLYAAVAQAMDDGLIAVLEAKYHYNFWRPVTAIRNADNDGHPATERDASWVSLSDAPLHPEYPSAHSILAGAVGTILKAEIGNSATPVLATTSPSAKGATRRWNTIQDFMQEVADARVYEGIHYRFSTEAGLSMGEKLGALAVDRIYGDPR